MIYQLEYLLTQHTVFNCQAAELNNGYLISECEILYAALCQQAGKSNTRGQQRKLIFCFRSS